MNSTTFISPLADEIERFLRYKRAAGCKYREEERALRCLDRFLDSLLTAQNPVITLAVVRAYLSHGGKRSETRREHQLSVIRELCRFLAVEDSRNEIPPRKFLGIRRKPYVQRVLSREEGKRFLIACSNFPPARCSPIRGTVHGTALTLLYLTGLRLGEVLRLTIGDVDLSGGLLHVRLTKFGKSRLVPVAPDVTEKMQECRKVVQRRLGPRDSQARFFVGPTGKPVSRTALRTSFREMLSRADIAQHGSVRRPRVHDLRGTFAVHRLLLWYEQDADLDAKLPLLSTYLGHVGLASSQRYLQLTKEFVGEVSRRQQARFGHLIKD